MATMLLEAWKGKAEPGRQLGNSYWDGVLSQRNSGGEGASQSDSGCILKVKLSMLWFGCQTEKTQR